jgi:hypothetical protein
MTLGVRPGTTSVISAARQLNQENRPCHLLWDPLTGDLAQMLPIVRAGCMLGTPDCLGDSPRCLPGCAASVNREGRLCVQIAVLGTEREPFTSGPMVRLGDILGWLDSWRIPRRWPAGQPALYRQDGCPQSRALWARGGHYGASQVPDCDSPGPGSIDIGSLSSASSAVVIQPQPPDSATGRAGQRSRRPDAASQVLDLLGLDLLGPDLDLLRLDLHHPGGAGVADSPTAKLVQQCQEAVSRAEQAIADSRRVAEDLAAAQDRLAITLIQLAARLPQTSDRLMALSETARMQALFMRDRARSALPNQTRRDRSTGREHVGGSADVLT